MKGRAVLTRGRCRPPQAAMPLCSELMSRPKKAVAGSRPERTTPGGSSRAGRGRQYCKLRWLLSAVIGIFQCIFELKMPRPVIWQRFTSTNSCHEPPLLSLVFGSKNYSKVDSPTTQYDNKSGHMGLSHQILRFAYNMNDRSCASRPARQVGTRQPHGTAFFCARREKTRGRRCRRRERCRARLFITATRSRKRSS